MKLLKSLSKTLIAIYVLIGILLFVFQRDFLYFPTVKTADNSQSQKFVIGEETINVIVLNKGQKKAILYFGGNGEAVVKNAASFSKIFASHTVYLVNYRGYGGSTGTPSEQGFYSDAQFIYDVLANQYRQISVIGRSLGTGVATFLASTRAIEKMVLVTPYDSILNIAQDQYPLYPVSLILKDKYDSASRIKSIISPTLIIVAEKDVIIPAKYSDELIKLFPPAQLTVVVIRGAGHNNITQKPQYYKLLQEFI